MLCRARDHEEWLPVDCRSERGVGVCRRRQGGRRGRRPAPPSGRCQLADGAITRRRISMSERLILKEASRANSAWLAVPLVVLALITLTVGLVARRTVREPYATPFFHPFFTDTLQMKAWLVTATVVLACGQLVTAARIYDLLGFPPKGGFYQAVHRWSGRTAIILTLPVAYH